ncbi:MAG: queuosine precursor transporter [Phycisphaeraceae bacterium]|nr:MAG: queuosine precursor transporter [Phycisphaeraceae bacterium]
MSSPAALLPSAQHEYAGLPRLGEATLHKRRENVFLVLAGLFLGTLAMLNILGITRFIVLASFGPAAEGAATWVWAWGKANPWSSWNFAVAVGVLPYPMTFLCTDFISELYGRARANFVVVIGLFLNIWVMLILWLGGALPGFENVDASGQIVRDAAGRLPVFFEVRNLAFGAVTASMIAYLAAQFVDVQLFHFWKWLTKNRHMWLRNNGSTMISQIVDTVSVILITHFYAHALPIDAQRALWPQLFVFIATGYAFKFVAAALDTVPFIVASNRLAKYLRLPPPTHQSAVPGAAAVESGVG